MVGSGNDVHAVRENRLARLVRLLLSIMYKLGKCRGKARPGTLGRKRSKTFGKIPDADHFLANTYILVYTICHPPDSQ